MPPSAPTPPRGERIGSLKLAQLQRLLAVYGLTEAEFFDSRIEQWIAPWELDETQRATARLLDNLHALPTTVRRSLPPKFQLMVEAVVDVQGSAEKDSPAPIPRRLCPNRRACNADQRQWPRIQTQS